MLVIGLDLGTSSCKALAVDANGDVMATASSAYTLLTPQPGYVELDPKSVWVAVVTALRGLSEQISLADVTGIAFSGAMHSLLAVDGQGEPLAKSPTWADMRAAAQAQELRALPDAQALYARTGCPPASNYHPARLRWFAAERPHLWERAARFVSLKDWVVQRLCGEWVTDIGLASTTGLLDIHTQTWDEEALHLAGITPERLPGLVAPDALVGGLLPSAAAQMGLPVDLPVIPGGADGGLANLGSGAVSPGACVVTIGTSGALRLVLDQPLIDPLSRTWCYLLREGHWYAGGAINNGGLAVQWTRQTMYGDLSEQAGFDRLMAEAAGAQAAARGLFFLPYLTGERAPHWNPLATGVFHGLRLEHGRPELARATLEGVAFCLADVWQAITAQAQVGAPIHLTGGVTRSPVWCQILADVLGVELGAHEDGDASAVGAALMALRAFGRDGAAVKRLSTRAFDQVYRPDPGQVDQYRQYHQRFQEYYSHIQPDSGFHK